MKIFRGLLFALTASIIFGVTAQAQTTKPHLAPLTIKLATAKMAESAAVGVALSHINSWSHHNWGTSMAFLAEDVKVVTMTTQKSLQGTQLSGADAYMVGLQEFASAVQPGSAKIISATGDKHNALVLLTVRAKFAPTAPEITLAAARMYLIDDNQKIKSEQVIFYAAEQ